MRKPFYQYLVLVAVSIAGQVSANTLASLEVDDHVVLFTTAENKTHALPSCVGAGNENTWSITLATDSGRAIYSLLLTAMAKRESMGVQIESGQDCAVLAGIERAQSVNIVAQEVATASAGAGYRISLYQGDGVTRVGTVVEQTSPKSWYYVDDEAVPETKHVGNSIQPRGILFDGPDCTGNTFSSYQLPQPSVYSNYRDDIYLASPGPQVSVSVHSELRADGNCSSYAAQPPSLRYPVIPTPHPICGIGPCVLKED